MKVDILAKFGWFLFLNKFFRKLAFDLLTMKIMTPFKFLVYFGQMGIVFMRHIKAHLTRATSRWGNEL